MSAYLVSYKFKKSLFIKQNVYDVKETNNLQLKS